MVRVDVLLTQDPAVLRGAGAFGVGAVVRLERSATQTGTFAEVAFQAVAAGTYRYTFWDSGDNTMWYRWRVASDDTGSPASTSLYSAPFQGIDPVSSSAPVSYAVLGDLLPLFETTPNQSRFPRLDSLLQIATAEVIEQCGGRDYFRHPAVGTTTWVLDGIDGSDVLHAHEGLISVSLLELSFDGGLTYVPVTATDYVLRGDSPYLGEPPPAGEPYFHIRFTGFGSYVVFQQGVQAIRLTGARGWAAWPTVLREATVERARQLAYAEGSYSGSAAGPTEYGAPPAIDRFWPQSFWNWLTKERERFMGCIA